MGGVPPLFLIQAAQYAVQQGIRFVAIHRDTRGLVGHRLSLLMQKGTLCKHYQVLVCGKPDSDEGELPNKSGTDYLQGTITLVGRDGTSGPGQIANYSVDSRTLTFTGVKVGVRSGSYTHLDVYKRQIVHSSNAKEDIHICQN